MSEFTSSSQSFTKLCEEGYLRRNSLTELQLVQKVKKARKEGKNSMIFDHLRKKTNERSGEKNPKTMMT